MKTQVAFFFIFNNMLPLEKLFITSPPASNTQLPPPSVHASPYRNPNGSVVQFRP